MSDIDSRPGEHDGGGPPPARLTRTVFITVPRAIIAVLILGGIAINFANVVSRHVFSAAIFWAEEILVFLVIWFVSIAVAAVTYQGAHLKMDLLSTRIPAPWKHVINAAMVICFVIVCALVVAQSFEVVTAFRRTGTVSIAASVPLVIPHAALLVGFALMVLAVIARLRAHLSGKF